MKYIIEFDDKQLLEYDKNTDTYFKTLFKAKGFNALVFDKNGLDKLTPLDKELEEAYQKGFEAGQHEATTLEYQQGLNDAWEAITKIAKMPDGERMMHFGEVWISNILNAYNLEQIFTILEKSEFEPDEIKVGDEVIALHGKGIVIDRFTDKDLNLDGSPEEVCEYWYYESGHYDERKINLDRVRNLRKTGRHFPQMAELLEALKGEQRNCSACEHDGDSRFCDPCRHNDMWQPKGDAE